MASSVSSSRWTTSPPQTSQVQSTVGAVVDVVVGAAVDADPPAGEAVEDDLGGHLEVEHEVERLVGEDSLELLGLAHGAREAVEDEAALERRRPAARRSSTTPITIVVGHQLAAVHVLLAPRARVACPAATAARSMSPVEMCGTP